MMKRHKKFIKQIVAICLFFTSVMTSIITFDTEEVQGATSYTDPVAFYNSSPKHIECYDSTIYYGTRGNLATSDTNLKWNNIAWEVELMGGGVGMQFEIAIGGQYLTKACESVKYNGYEYNLYAISLDKIYTIAKSIDSSKAETIFNSDDKQAYFTAIIVKRYHKSSANTPYDMGNGKYLSGYVSGESNGNVSYVGNVYHLSNASDLNTMSAIYTRASRNSWEASYINLWIQLTEGSGASTGGSSITYIDQGNVLETNSIRSFDTVTMRTVGDLRKTGYHLESGKEWQKQGTASYFATGNSYAAPLLDPIIASGDVAITMESNWLPNTYFIKYNANGAGGAQMNNQKCIYDEEYEVWNCTYRMNGYKFLGWSTTPVATGQYGTSTANTPLLYNNNISGKEKLESYIEYDIGMESTVYNMTDVHMATIDVYAIWEPLSLNVDLNAYITPKERNDKANNAYTLNLEKKDYDEGTRALYEVYNTLWSSSDIYENISMVNKFSDSINIKGGKITYIPWKTGYDFIGYFTSLAGTKQITTASGKVIAETTTYDEDGKAYALWNPITINITFDQNGGYGGTRNTTATYDEPFETGLSAPYLEGWTFKGYFYIDKNGKETQIYDEYMMPCITSSDFTEDVTLIAYWVDDTAPEVSLHLSADSWTNADEGVIVTPIASDYGTGLKSVRLTWSKNGQTITEIYYDNISATTTYNTYSAYVEATGATKSVAHFTEGSFAYTIVATDMNGNTSETRGKSNKITGIAFTPNEASYSAPVYYDITAPTISGSYNDAQTQLDLTITDMKP